MGFREAASLGEERVRCQKCAAEAQKVVKRKQGRDLFGEMLLDLINDTSGNRTRAVRRVLGADAIFAARVLFAIAGVSLASVVVAARLICDFGCLMS